MFVFAFNESKSGTFPPPYTSGTDLSDSSLLTRSYKPVQIDQMHCDVRASQYSSQALSAH